MSLFRWINLLWLSVLSSLALANEVFPPLKLGVPGKKKGEIIAPVIDEQIAAWCDFNKQIVVTKKNVLCAYVGDGAGQAEHLKTASANGQVVASQKKGPAAPKDLGPNLYEMKEYSNVEIS
ncbi:MAG TPA: hypothetical protein VHA13_01830 [Gammaproteobacteria bacterium]|nr:hypothetical protein [Gammaproteobacteria bacterium]